MAENLQIATPFGELSELVEHFAQRVGDGRLMLPYPQTAAEGEWATFQLFFADGTLAFEGTGKITGAYDNGEEHPPEYRYDLVLEELTFEGTNEVVYERMVMSRDSLSGAEPGTGEVAVPDEAPPPPAEATGAVDISEMEDAEEADAGFVDAETSVGAPVEAPRAKPAAPPPARAPRTLAVHDGKLPSPHAGDASQLRRPTHPSAWSPEPIERPPAAQSSGLFDYEGGLPRPAAPPRPDIEPDLRVQPAPSGPS